MTTDQLKAYIKRTPLYPLIRPRRFHAYCLGAAKTGTVSVAAMCKAHYRAAHEPLEHGTAELVLHAHDGTLERSKWPAMLRRRDRALFLELESSHFMAIFAGTLADVFEKARFILTVRDAKSWLESIINQQINYPLKGPWAPFYLAIRNIDHSTSTGFHAGERVLEQLGLFSLDGYLSYWARQTRGVMDAVPHERLLVLRTEEISRSLSRIAGFLGIPETTLNAERSHSHLAPRKHNVLDQIDASFLADKIAEYSAGMEPVPVERI